MAEILKGAPVAAALRKKIKQELEEMAEPGIEPTLGIVRVGDSPEADSYERGAMKSCEAVGIGCECSYFSEDSDPEEFYATLAYMNTDPGVDGTLLLTPLPEGFDAETARKIMAPEKDVDGWTDGSLAGVFTNTDLGFPPCTAQAVMEMLRYYGISCEGKRAVVIGRSLVVGRPLAMMLMHENATVTICHTHTKDLASVVKEADLVFACAGVPESIGAEYLREGQVVIDVGVSFSEEKQKLCGDVYFEEAEPIVAAISPVPGGVGAVTNTVLVSHVVEAAKRRYKRETEDGLVDEDEDFGVLWN